MTTSVQISQGPDGVLHPVCPVSAAGPPTGLDSGEPRGGRWTAKMAIDPPASISGCQFWKDRFQKSASPS